MLRRPQPSDGEADLLREQERFLASGAPSAASVLRRPDKRRGRSGEVEGEGEGSQENGGIQKDVVTIEDLPDQLPSLTPAPPKKSRFKASRVTFEVDDAEERLDAQDTHISAVLSRIVERDTSSTPISLPTFTGIAFPKVMHRSETSSQAPPSSVRGKKSIFARQIAAQKLNEAKTLQLNSSGSPQNLPVETDMDFSDSSSQSRLVSGQGLRVSDGPTETLRIHMENQAKLRAMSQPEILEEQKKLLSQLDPRLVEFVRSRKLRAFRLKKLRRKKTLRKRLVDLHPVRSVVKGAWRKRSHHQLSLLRLSCQ
ncbi:RNA polymerase II-associated protein 1 [Oryzias melastigma]|uniref:RNA polymerase II-associated protein 1 n=1 Tax=Oryzias melastigma TaxID=30732 RepID=A0A834F5L7_ORYME|nr:RNA polymerase II-associated protein 1 [Oryzias melastigma]